MPFKFLEHTADIKIEVTEKTLEKSFATSALAMREVIAEKIKVQPKIKKEIAKEAKDLPALLYAFLEEFLYLLDAKDFLLSEVEKIKIERAPEAITLKAEVAGDKASNYAFTNDVKAITYNEMSIKEHKNKWIIQFVLDV
jgi:SHS2 domain-containing protein